MELLDQNHQNLETTKTPILELSLVVPVFNEEATIDPFLSRINHIFNPEKSLKLEIVFVNDGSTDSTMHLLLEHQKQDDRIIVIELSRNFGKESALSAGLQIAKGQVIVPIDVDLQDPPELILEMIAKWRNGFDVVLGHRMNRDSDSYAKQFLATWFYRIHNKISELTIPENVGDFRLMDRKVVEALSQLPESRRFMKGLFAWVGFKTAVINYTRPKRIAGSTKFNSWRLWNFALEGITSFSLAPLRIWTYLGGVVSLASFGFALFILIKAIVCGIEVPGYASMMVVITFLGGLQLIGIGIIGEYLGRTYIESKRRPIFLIRHIYAQIDTATVTSKFIDH